MNRRDFLRVMGLGLVATATPKFIFDVGANLYRRDRFWLPNRFDGEPGALGLDALSCIFKEVYGEYAKNVYRDNPSSIINLLPPSEGFISIGKVVLGFLYLSGMISLAPDSSGDGDSFLGVSFPVLVPVPESAPEPIQIRVTIDKEQCFASFHKSNQNIFRINTEDSEALFLAHSLIAGIARAQMCPAELDNLRDILEGVIRGTSIGS